MYSPITIYLEVEGSSKQIFTKGIDVNRINWTYLTSVDYTIQSQKTQDKHGNYKINYILSKNKNKTKQNQLTKQTKNPRTLFEEQKSYKIYFRTKK